jgi:hypothetical protein
MLKRRPSAGYGSYLASKLTEPPPYRKSFFKQTKNNKKRKETAYHKKVWGGFGY